MALHTLTIHPVVLGFPHNHIKPVSTQTSWKWGCSGLRALGPIGALRDVGLRLGSGRGPDLYFATLLNFALASCCRVLPKPGVQRELRETLL